MLKNNQICFIYILDEISIKKSGLPFLNLKYKVWKFGPVSEELFIDLSSETKLLEDYILYGKSNFQFFVLDCNLEWENKIKLERALDYYKNIYSGDLY